MRHNELRDLGAELLDEVCKDVQTEPSLLPCEKDQVGPGGTDDPGARLDISARGFWAPMQRAFFDVRVIHLNSPSYVDQAPQQIYQMHEKRKKKMYNKRVINVEHGTFTPATHF